MRLITAQPPNLAALNTSAKIPRISAVTSLFPFKVDYFGVYQKLAALIPALGSQNADIVFNTNGLLLPTNNNSQFTYMHFPPMLLGSDEYPSKYQSSFFWKAYFKLYASISGSLLDRCIDNAKILTNSKFTLEAIRKVWSSANASILHPPVMLDRFRSFGITKRDSGKVLVVARFSAEKQLEKVVEIAKLSQGLRFDVMGSLIPSNHDYFHSLQRLISKSGVRDRVTLRANASSEELVDAMTTSSVYLHTMRGEHFGTTVVEAMSAGLIPVVPNYGGCSEIVPSVFQYETAEQASRLVEKCATLSEMERDFFRAQASRFSYPAFREKLKNIIEQAGVRTIESTISIR